MGSSVTGDDGGRRTTSGSGLETNLAGALSYLLGIVTGVIFFVVDDDPFVRFHAAQSIVLSVVFIVLNVVVSVLSSVLFAVAFAIGSGPGGAFGPFGILTTLFGLVWSLFGLLVFLGWLYLMYTAYQGNRTRIPVVAGVADRLAAN